VNADGKIDAADASYASNAINAVAVASDDMSGATFSQKVGSGANIAVLTTAFGQRTVAGAQKTRFAALGGKSLTVYVPWRWPRLEWATKPVIGSMQTIFSLSFCPSSL
jgi:hypothetical protein